MPFSVLGPIAGGCAVRTIAPGVALPQQASAA